MCGNWQCIVKTYTLQHWFNTTATNFVAVYCGYGGILIAPRKWLDSEIENMELLCNAAGIWHLTNIFDL